MNILEKLYLLKDDKYQDFSSKLIPNTLPIIGVRVPELRKIAKEIIKNDYKIFLEKDSDFYEMQLLKAYVIGYAKMDIDTRFYYLDKFIPSIKDWAVNDGLVSSLKVVNNNQREFFNYLLKYRDSKDEFTVRFLVIMFMSYYLKDDYIDRVITILKEISINGYYAKMGVAWCLATALISYPDKILKLLKDNIFEDWIINKTISKARESYRINEELKEELLMYKKGIKNKKIMI